MELAWSVFRLALAISSDAWPVEFPFPHEIVGVPANLKPSGGPASNSSKQRRTVRPSSRIALFHSSYIQGVLFAVPAVPTGRIDELSASPRVSLHRNPADLRLTHPDLAFDSKPFALLLRDSGYAARGETCRTGSRSVI